MASHAGTRVSRLLAQEVLGLFEPKGLLHDWAPGTNGEEIQRLYGDIEKEQLKLGKLPNITIEQLKSMVQKQSDLVRERYHVNAVGFPSLPKSMNNEPSESNSAEVMLSVI